MKLTMMTWLGVVVLTASLLVACSSEPEGTLVEQRLAAIEAGEAEPIPYVSAIRLHYGREENATRHDATYKGKIYRIYGEVKQIENEVVTLGIDDIYGGYLDFVGVDLNDMPLEDQIPLNRWDRVSAVCVIGDSILGSIQANDCILESAEPP